MSMTTDQLRDAFLGYFKQHGHAVVPSSPVVPHDDPTLLFANAGMNQFKDLFLGEGERDYRAAATSQKCIRVGGKHNDLENVGHTTRHMTFFEMLGNFSFGDYFKAEAIRHAWTLVTEVLKIDPDRIWPSVFREDDEAFEIWSLYLPSERIVRLGERDNFWVMGETGPCGPCSELLFDRGKEYGSARTPYEDTEGERFLEFWNLVFMQYNRDKEGRMTPLPRKCIDTGMGLERMLALKSGVRTVFETDVLARIIAEVEEIAKVAYGPSQAAAFHVIADHLRCLAFAIADGVVPSNVDRGYVLRKVLRRAVRYGRQLGLRDPFLARLVPALIERMGGHYGELKASRERICEILTLEEEAFLRTLQRGGNLLNQVVESAQESAAKQIGGEEAFKLKDTYGLPLEEILLIAKDSDLTVDLERYQALEQEARDRSRAERKVTHQQVAEGFFREWAEKHGATLFQGYNSLSEEATVLGIVRDGAWVDLLKSGEEGLVLLDRTPFYAEKGGQVGDTGRLTAPGMRGAVVDCQSPYSGLTTHTAVVEEGQLEVGQRLTAAVDRDRRWRIANNHTATHLLHWALQRVAGEQVGQAGSLVAPDRLRFDFHHHKALSPEELRRIEDLVNEKIWSNFPVVSAEISYAEAQKRPEVKQFFGDKYGATVRLVAVGDESQELCGGTHVDAIGRIGSLRILSESSVAAGIRRIEAVTGREAVEAARLDRALIEEAAGLLKAPSGQLLDRIHRLLQEHTEYAREMRKGREEQLKSLAKSLAETVERAGAVALVRAQVEVEADDLRLFADQLIAQMGSGVAVLGRVEKERCSLLVRVSDDLVGRGVSAGKLIQQLAPLIEGRGGGKADAAQAGGRLPERLPDALAHAVKVCQTIAV